MKLFKRREWGEGKRERGGGKAPGRSDKETTREKIYM